MIGYILGCLGIALVIAIGAELYIHGYHPHRHRDWRDHG